MIVYRPPFDVVEALGRGEQVWVPMKGRTVRCSNQWCENGTIYSPGVFLHPPHNRCSTCDGKGERLVAPIQPATPCPDCVAPHKKMAKRDGRWRIVDCSTCNGSGWVGGDLGLVTEQWRWRDFSWINWPPHNDDHPADWQRRLVVPWRTQVTELLPVYGHHNVPDDIQCLEVVPRGVKLYSEGDNDGFTWVSGEPWAQHLTPGMFVATLVGLWPIDPPVVDMPCEACRGTGIRGGMQWGSSEWPGCDVCAPGWTVYGSAALDTPPPEGITRVPLSVDPEEVVTL